MLFPWISDILPMEQMVTALAPAPEAWNAYVEGHPRATQYHRYEWLEVIRAAFGHRFFPLVVRRGERITGILPLVLVRSWLFGRFLVSMPFVNYGGILGDSEDAERQLWESAVALALETGAAHLEARHLQPHPFATERRQHKATMILDLADSVDEQWKTFNAKLRNQIRKAERSGLSARSAGPEELPRFYEVFARCMRDLGTPVYSRRFFAEILRAFPSIEPHLSRRVGSYCGRGRHRTVASRHPRSSVGGVAARVPTAVSEQPPVLDDHCSCD